MTNPWIGQSAEVGPFSILFVITSLGRGGAERKMILLAAGLIDRGHRVAIALLDGEGDLALEAEAKGVELIRLFTVNRCGPIPKFARFLRAVRKFSPDVVHSYLPRDNARVAVIKPLLALARLVWAIRASDMAWDHYVRAQNALWPVVTRLARRADLIISNSWSGAEHHIKLGYPEDRITVIPNGIDIDKFRPDGDAGIKFRQKNGIPLDAKVVGMLARFDPMKGQTLFLEIVRRVSEDVPNTAGVILGSHKEEQKREVLALADSHGVADGVRIFEATKPPWNALTSFDVLVVPSIFGEGFPNVIGEALACDIPVAAFDTVDSARLVEGVYSTASPRDVETLSRITVDFLRNHFGPQTRKRATHVYSQIQLCATTETIISNCRGLIQMGRCRAKRQPFWGLRAGHFC